MHELSITRDVVRTVSEHTGGRRVVGVRLRIGALAGVVPEAVRSCFDLAAAGTALDGAWLEIEDEPGSGRCRVCGEQYEMATLVARCPCGSADAELLAGRSLRVTSVEVV